MEALLETRGLCRQFGGFRAVDTVSLSVAPGTIHSVIGPNGAGKTTFFRLLTGGLAPSGGRVRFAGEDITGLAPHSVTRKGLAQSFQITNVFARLTVLESVVMAIVARRRRSADFFSYFHRSAPVRREALEIIAQIGLGALAGRQAGTLSHGDQRALEVALALATRPRLLMLDEPTAGMSPWETERMTATVQALARERGLTVLFSEHDMDVVFAISERVTVMHQGRIIAEGPPQQVRANAEVTAVYLGSEA